MAAPFVFDYIPGVVRGATPTSAPNRWWNANGVRWRGGVARPIGGWDRVTSAPLDTLPRAILTWVSNSDVRYTALGCDSKLLIMSGGSVLDATPDGFTSTDEAAGSGGGYGAGPYGAEEYGTARSVYSFALARPYRFFLSSWGEDLLALASFDGKLYRWTPTAPAGPAGIIAEAPTGNSGLIVTPERHVVLLGAGGEPRRIAWCSREDYTDWDFMSVTNTAGFLDMETPGFPISAVRVREGTLIFTELDVWLLRYVGTPYIYGLERVGETTTLLSPNAVATFGGRAVWAGRSGFYLYDGGFVKALPSDVGDFMFADMDPTMGLFRAHASANGSFPEVWFFYPSVGQSECDRMVVWSHAEGWWSIGNLARTAMEQMGVNRVPIAAAPNGHVYYHETGWTDAGAPRFPGIFLEGGTVRVQGGQRQIMIRQVWPDTQGPTPLDFSFYAKDVPNGPERAYGPYLQRANGYLDVRLTGRDMRMRVRPTADGDWSLGQPVGDIRPRGGR